MANVPHQHVEKNPRIRRINETLVNLSEEAYNEEEEERAIDPFKECLYSWQRTVPNAKYVVPRRRRPLAAPSSLPEESLSVESTMTEAKHRNFELEFIDAPSWRLGIEPSSARYVVGNGRYRAHKLAYRMAKEKDSLRASNGRLTLEQKTLMAFIQRYFKKEFDVFLKMELQYKESRKKKELLAETGEEKTRRNSYDVQVAVKETEAVNTPSVELMLPQLPPLKAPRVIKSDGKAYVNNRLNALDEEIRFRSGKRPDTKGSSRSQSEPPGLGSLIDPLSQPQDGVRKSDRKLREEQRNRAQVQELADHLIHALCELKKTRDEELRRRFRDDESTADSPPDNSDTQSAPEVIVRPSRRLKVEPLPRLFPTGHSIKYQTTNGDIISVPRFGQYPTLDLAPETKLNRRTIPKRKKPSGSTVEPPVGLNHVVSDDVLRGMITTTKYTAHDDTLRNDNAKEGDKDEDDSGNMVADGFQPLPVGKPRHRQKRAVSPTVSEHKGILPVISGKSVSKVVTTNRIL